MFSMAKLPLRADRMLTASSKILVDLPVTCENAYEDAERNNKQICEMLRVLLSVLQLLAQLSCSGCWCPSRCNFSQENPVAIRELLCSTLHSPPDKRNLKSV